MGISNSKQKEKEKEQKPSSRIRPSDVLSLLLDTIVLFRPLCHMCQLSDHD